MYDTVLKIDSMNHWESVVYFMLMRNVLMPPILNTIMKVPSCSLVLNKTIFLHAGATLHAAVININLNPILQC